MYPVSNSFQFPDQPVFDHSDNNQVDAHKIASIYTVKIHKPISWFIILQQPDCLRRGHE